MKKTIISVLTIVLGFGSCNIDLQPQSVLTYNGFWQSEEAVKAAQVGLYDRLRNYNTTLWKMGESRSDVWNGPTLESHSDLRLVRNQISATNVFFTNWASFYRLIHYINDFIKNAPDVPFANENEKKHLLGQAHGLRAYIYYTLLKAYGKVPISTEPIVGVSDVSLLKRKRAEKEEVAELIKSDLQKSLDYFGDDNSLWNNSNKYWSKAVTLALKGDVYLWTGKVLGGGTTDFQEAKNALTAVSGFSIVPYNQLWGQANENNNEFMFVIDYQLNQVSGNFINFTMARQIDLNNKYDADGNSLAGFNSIGNNYYGISDKVRETLYTNENTNDLRRDAFVRVFNDDTGTDDAYAASIFTKFLGVVDNGQRLMNNNFPIYRYADVVLLLAEAKNNLGEDPSEQINTIRARAYDSNYNPATNAYTSTTQHLNAIAILQERLREFVGEGKRWWDLVRAGDDHLYREVETISITEPYKIYYSISETMMNNDPELEQTEGY